MRDLVLRVHTRRSCYAAFIAMSSSRRGASRDSRTTDGFIRARVQLRTTQLDSSSESVAHVFDNQLWPVAMAGFERHDATGFLRWVGPRQGPARRPPPGWTAVVLSRGRWTPAATATRTTGMSFDLNIELCVRLRAMSSTIALRVRSIGQKSGPNVLEKASGAALREWYRLWGIPTPASHGHVY